MTDKHGYIYVLTNTSFPEYVKIGYADNVDERVAQLNRSECTPFAFKKYDAKNGNLPLFYIEKDTRVGVLYAPFACVPLSMTNKKERLFKPKRVQASTGS